MSHGSTRPTGIGSWCDLFLATVPREQTLAEVAFIRRHLPLPDFARVLDVACGSGRHACELAGAGYDVVGVDKAPELIARATASCAAATFEVLDMREVGRLHGPFDAALSLWHSFGYFDDATNRAVLRQLHAIVRAEGRVVLDVYNRDHALRLPPVQVEQRGSTSVETRRSWQGDRWRVQLIYDGAPGDEFEWQLYSPEELRALAEACGFSTVVSCAWYDESVPLSREHARMQFVLERAR
jgi:SAM-dependent methyltransferase